MTTRDESVEAAVGAAASAIAVAIGTLAAAAAAWDPRNHSEAKLTVRVEAIERLTRVLDELREPFDTERVEVVVGWDGARHTIGRPGDDEEG